MHMNIRPAGLLTVGTATVAAAALIVATLSPPAQAEPAPNVYSYQLGSCNPNTGFTRTDALFTNVADAEGQAVGWVTVQPTLVATGGGATGSTAYDIHDGEPPRHIPLGVGNAGLRPGTWDLDFYLDSNPAAPASSVRAFVGPCGIHDVPPNDPSQPQPAPAPAAAPKGKLKQLSGHRVKVVSINKGVPKKTSFKLMIQPKHGKTVTHIYQVKSNAKKRKAYAAQVGTRFKLWGKVEVRQLGLIWKNLGELTVR